MVCLSSSILQLFELHQVLLCIHPVPARDLNSPEGRGSSKVLRPNCGVRSNCPPSWNSGVAAHVNYAQEYLGALIYDRTPTTNVWPGSANSWLLTPSPVTDLVDLVRAGNRKMETMMERQVMRFLDFFYKNHTGWGVLLANVFCRQHALGFLRNCPRS
jgi:hypothetical protein